MTLSAGKLISVKHFAFVMQEPLEKRVEIDGFRPWKAYARTGAIVAGYMTGIGALCLCASFYIDEKEMKDALGGSGAAMILSIPIWMVGGIAGHLAYDAWKDQS
jgi:hypothetical protein